MEPNEQEPTESIEPTTDQLIEAVKDHLTKEQIADLNELDLEAALGLVFSYLIEVGIDDPEQFLTEKGILEQN